MPRSYFVLLKQTNNQSDRVKQILISNNNNNHHHHRKFNCKLLKSLGKQVLFVKLLLRSSKLALSLSLAAK